MSRKPRPLSPLHVVPPDTQMTAQRGAFCSDGVHYSDLEYAAMTSEVLGHMRDFSRPVGSCPSSQPPSSPLPPSPAPAAVPPTPQMVPADAMLGLASALACLLLAAVVFARGARIQE